MSKHTGPWVVPEPDHGDINEWHLEMAEQEADDYQKSLTEVSTDEDTTEPTGPPLRSCPGCGVAPGEQHRRWQCSVFGHGS